MGLLWVHVSMFSLTRGTQVLHLSVPWEIVLQDRHVRMLRKVLSPVASLFCQETV